MLDAISRQDSKGFYRVGPLKTYSKLEAIKFQQYSGKNLDWNFNDEIYGRIDWQTEPSMSLKNLYKIRALQLREKYDHLVLWFSGGADSTNILDTFVENNILLDEVASFVNYEATKDKLNYMNAEIYHVAKQKIENINKRQSWPCHTVVDTSQLTIDRFTDKETKFDWIYQLNSALNPNHTAKIDIKLQIKRWREMFNSGKRVGFIYGIDKPRVTQIKNKFFFRFVDMIDIAVSAANQMRDQPWDFDELFYWSPECPEIVIKQAHVIKRHIKSLDATSDDLTDQKVGLVATTKHNRIQWLKMDRIHQLIYPGWFPVPYQRKPQSLIYSPRDTWFFNLPDLDPAKKAWRIGLEHLWSSVDNRWKVDPSNIAFGLKPIHSQLYDLGD